MSRPGRQVSTDVPVGCLVVERGSAYSPPMQTGALARCLPALLVACGTTGATGTSVSVAASSAPVASAPRATSSASGAPLPRSASAICPPEDVADCKAKCGGGDLDSCTRLASIYAFGNANVPVDLPAATEVYTKACNGGHGKACYYLAGEYELGRGVAKDTAKQAELLKKAVPLLTSACDGEPGDGESCVLLADLHMLGTTLPKDPEREKARRSRADALYGKACHRDDPSACSMSVFAKIHDKDGKGAEEEARLGCDGGDGDSCEILASLYNEGFPGIDQDAAKALEFYALACKRGRTSSCSHVKGR